MSEIPVKVPVGSFYLEGLMEEGEPETFAVLCHPHPLYGGSMDNNVVSQLQSTFRHLGYGTLRFNFRGIGGSGGAYGEGEGEVEDVFAVFEYLETLGVRSLHIMGYSFGAWVALRAIQRDVDVDSMILVSPPLDFLDFTNLVLPAKPCLLTLGSRDSFCTVNSLQEWLATRSRSPKFLNVEILPDCDHFYRGHEQTLSAFVTAFVKDRKWRMNG